MKKCIIFGAAEIDDYSAVKLDDNAFIIAADGGYEHLKKLNIVPNLLLGDFDSLKSDMPSNCEIMTVPAEKDDTDMMLAAKVALDRGFDEIVMYGALKGRLDHAFANIQMLEYINAHGGNGILMDTDNEVHLLTCGEYTYFRRDDWYFSIFSLSSSTEVTTTGTKYNLTNYKLNRQFSLGVSNEITEDICNVSVFSGVLLVIFSKK